MSTATLSGLRDYLYGTLSTDDMIWLIKELTGYIHKESEPVPYTMDELNARIDKSERQMAMGEYSSTDDVFSRIRRKYEKKAAEQLDEAFAV